MMFILRNPLSNKTTVNSNMTNLFTMLLSDELNEYSYDANLADLDYDLSLNEYGVEVTFTGYSDKIGLLMNKVFEKMVTLQIDPLRFSMLKENVSCVCSATRLIEMIRFEFI